MSIERFFTTPVTIIEPGSTSDGYNGTAPDWDNPTSETAVYGWLTQVSTTEEIGGRDLIVTYDQLTLPAGTVVSAAARVQSGSTIYQVDGKADTTPQTPRGGEHHVVVRLLFAQEVVV